MNLRAARIARIALILAQVFTGAAFILGLSAVSALQHRANALGLAKLYAADPVGVQPIVELYDSMFNNGLQVPYPTQPQYQFEYQFFLAFFQVTIFLFIDVMAAFPRLVPYGKSTALTFLAVALTLTMDLTNSLLYFTRSPLSVQTFGKTRTQLALASAIIVAVANCVTIIALGVWCPEMVESMEPMLDEQRHHAISKAMDHKAVEMKGPDLVASGNANGQAREEPILTTI